MAERETIAPGIDRFAWPSGLRLLTEHVPWARTVALGLWMDTGSRDEPAEKQGVTHLLEHMFFKATTRRSTEALALEMNAMGGHFNAYTSQESVCLHARVIAEHLERALPLLVEMQREGMLAEEELARERMVVLDEILMTNDMPDELVHDLFQEALFGETGLGRSILGTPDTVGALAPGDLRSHMSHLLRLDRVVIAMAGAIQPEVAAGLVDNLLGRLDPPTTNGPRDPTPAPLWKSRALDRDFEQVHFCLGTLAPTRASEARYAFNLLHSVLGGGASSRLFQEVRERRGLAYAIGSFASPFQDTGCFGVTGGTAPEHLEEVLAISVREMRRLMEEPIGAEELANAKEQARAHLLLGLESMSHRMTRLAELELYFGRHIPLEETLERLAAVTSEEILAWASDQLGEGNLSTVVIGPGADAVSLPESL